MVTLLDIVEKYSDWSGIHLNAGKYKSTVYIIGLLSIRENLDRNDALRARLAHITLGGQRMGNLSQDEPLPGGYLGTALTASLCPDAHLRWTKRQLEIICNAFHRAPLPSHIKPHPSPHGTLRRQWRRWTPS